MSDKPVAALVTAAVVAPLCAVCILGPTVFASTVAGGFGWLTGLGPMPTTGLAVVSVIAILGYVARRKRRPRRDAASAAAFTRQQGLGSQ